MLTTRYLSITLNPLINAGLLALIGWAGLTSLAVGQSADMRFRFSDGSEVAGNLVASNRSDHLAIRSRVFAQPLVIPIERLIEGYLPQDESLDLAQASAAEIDPRSEGALAISLDNGDLYVGRVVAVDDGVIELNSIDLGVVKIHADRVIRVAATDVAPRTIRTLTQSQHRFNGEPGWSMQGATLVGQTPESVAVLRWELPNRFHLHLEVACDGEADFELTLGDHSASGAGQGGQRVDRRGGSLSRTPSERFVTRLEWIGRSVALVRSNASVSDSEVFDLPFVVNRLQLDLYIDQAKGRMAAYRNGLLVADVSIRDDQPVLRRELSLITRGGPVTVQALELLRWEGTLPASRALPDRFTLLRDGTSVGEVIQLWGDGQFQVDGVWRPYRELLRMETGVNAESNSGNVEPGCEWWLRDGSRLQGRIGSGTVRSDSPTTETAKQITLLDSSGAALLVDATRVEAVTSAIAVAGIPTPTPSDHNRVLHSDQTRIVGQLRHSSMVNAAADQSPANPFSWQASVAVDPVDIAATEGVTIDWISPDRISPDPGDDSDFDADESVGRRCVLCLINGDRMPGELIAIDRDQIRFRGPSCGEVTLAARHVRRVQWQSTIEQNAADRNYLLSLPRRMNDSPPTHVLVSTTGDALRGRLMSLDNSAARIEVRGAIRLIDRSAIAEVIWIAEAERESEECRYVINTRGAAQLGLASARLENGQIIAAHDVFGVCRFPLGDVIRLRLGTRQPAQQESWNLVPVKEPKTFE